MIRTFQRMPVTLPSAALFLALCVSACGQDERIEAVSRAGLEDGGGSTAVTDPFAPPDDTSPGPVPTASGTGRPMPSGTTAPQPSTPTPVVNSNLGMRCEADADCGANLVCMQQGDSDFLGGGPAGGMCTASCTTDANCLALDSESLCLQMTETQAICMPSCVPGDGLLGESKCGGRLDMACESLSDGIVSLNFCRPMCGTDAECGDRLCDLGLGVCMDELLPGAGIGSACTPPTEGVSEECQSGFCLALTETYGACTGLCRTGTVGCGSGNQDPMDPGEPICLALGTDTGLDGDVGRCIQRCNCDLDCVHPDAKCYAPFDDDAQGLATFGTIGLCINGDAAEMDPTARIGIECDDDRPMPGDSGVPSDSGASNGASTDSGSAPNMSMEPPSDASTPAVMTDASISDGG